MTQPDLSDIHHADYERVACIVFCTLSPLFLLGRFVSRILSRQLGLDDWSALAACTFALSCNIQTLVAISHGWGRHIWNLTPKQVVFVLIITYKISVALNKISILLLYLRIMPTRPFRLACYSLLTLVSLFAFATTVAGVLQCMPVDKAWKKSKPGHCYKLVEAWYTNAVFSIVTDFLILFLPMRMVYTLQRSRKEKMMLYAIFGVGSFVTFTSIMRFFALKVANSKDTTYSINSGFWSIIEINVGVICICLPPLRALFARAFFPSTLPSLPTDPRYPFSLPSPNLPLSKQSVYSHSQARGRRLRRSQSRSGNANGHTTGDTVLEGGSEEELVGIEAAPKQTQVQVRTLDEESKADVSSEQLRSRETRILIVSEFEVSSCPDTRTKPSIA